MRSAHAVMYEGDVSSGDSSDPLVVNMPRWVFHEKGRAHEDIKRFYGLLCSADTHTHTHTEKREKLGIGIRSELLDTWAKAPP